VKLNEEYELVKELGDNIGAHVLHGHLENTLNSLDTSWEGFIQVGEIAGKVAVQRVAKKARMAISAEADRPRPGTSCPELREDVRY
jgi:hypothetical protein